MFYSIVILALACISFVPISVLYLCSYIDLISSPNRATRRSPPVSFVRCHVRNPMRHSNRVSTLLARPRTAYLDHRCFTSRPLSSCDPANAAERFSTSLTDHAPRFDWRLRVPHPKSPLSTISKVLEKRAQPPLPTDSYPYDVHIQKYKDQSVTHHVRSPPIDYPHYPPVSSPFYRPNARRMRPSLENASRTGV